jgi:hypothetical protein
MFAQGGKCFFCDAVLPKAEASVEHLVASARAGSNGDDNCVVCCKSMNALLGSMSLKEKIKVVLNQKGSFKCPNGKALATPVSGSQKPTPASATTPKKQPKTSLAPPVKKPPTAVTARVRNFAEDVAAIVEILKARSRPRNLSSLKAILKALADFKLTDQKVNMVIEHLQDSGQLEVKNEQVTYKL